MFYDKRCLDHDYIRNVSWKDGRSDRLTGKDEQIQIYISDRLTNKQMAMQIDRYMIDI